MARARTSRKFIELVERLMTRWGYTTTEGKIYATLLLADEPMTISELAEKTRLSRSSVSVSLSKLQREYMVHCRREGKTKYFTAVPAFLEKFLRQPRDMLEREVRPLKDAVLILMETAGDKNRARLNAILDDLSALECVLELIIRVEEEESECLKKR